jgi:DNA-binding LytR/AlgR family response regulator
MMQKLNKLKSQFHLYSERNTEINKIAVQNLTVKPQDFHLKLQKPIEPGCIRVVLIEREINSLKYLEDQLVFLGNISIIKKMQTLKEAREYFNCVTESAHLLFTEIELKDGIVFDLIADLDVEMPIVYLSQTEKYRERALILQGLEYFVIPDQYRELMSAFSIYYKMTLRLGRPQWISNSPRFQTINYERLVVRKGLESIIIMVNEIAIVYTHNNLVFVLTGGNHTYRIDKKLNELEAKLSGLGFFRISRQHIVNIKFIKGYKTLDKIKLLLTMKDITWSNQLIVSQDYTPGFKKWIASC